MTLPVGKDHAPDTLVPLALAVCGEPKQGFDNGCRIFGATLRQVRDAEGACPLLLCGECTETLHKMLPSAVLQLEGAESSESPGCFEGLFNPGQISMQETCRALAAPFGACSSLPAIALAVRCNWEIKVGKCSCWTPLTANEFCHCLPCKRAGVNLLCSFGETSAGEHFPHGPSM